MRVFRYKINQKLPFDECVLALGLFDGVHIAHRDLLSCAKERARGAGIPFGIFTFSAEDSFKTNSPRLYSTDEKLKLFERCDADFVIIADFASLSTLTPSEFVKTVLIKELGCRICVAGFNFRFGHRASGNADDLARFMSENGGEAIIRDELTFNNSTVSTTRIRALIADGKISEANLLLGAPYFISGKVTHGNSKGKHLGFPTANTSFTENELIPKIGVYRTAIPIGEKIYCAITNIGVCPTFDSRPVHAETYIIDFNSDIYNDDVEIYLLEYLREERRFNSEKELIMQINVDKNIAIKKNGDITWQKLGLK